MVTNEVLDCMKKDYQANLKFKEDDPDGHQKGIVLQQSLLMKLPAKMSPLELAVYSFWRCLRACSVTSMLEHYKRLGVDLKLEDCKGETFYAGVPCVTQDEVDTIKSIEGAEVIVKSDFDRKVSEHSDNIMLDNNGDYRYFNRYTEEWGEIAPENSINWDK